MRQRVVFVHLYRSEECTKQQIILTIEFINTHQTGLQHCNGRYVCCENADSAGQSRNINLSNGFILIEYL